MKYLLDTNVLKEVGKAAPHRNVASWLDRVDDIELAISAISIREIWKGLARKRKKDPALAARLEDAAIVILEAFHRRILAVDEIVARRWGKMLGESDKNVDDTGLAATADVHKLVMVTRNEADFAGRGVVVLNPFKQTTSPSNR